MASRVKGLPWYTSCHAQIKRHHYSFSCDLPSMWLIFLYFFLYNEQVLRGGYGGCCMSGLPYTLPG